MHSSADGVRRVAKTQAFALGLAGAQPQSDFVEGTKPPDMADCPGLPALPWIGGSSSRSPRQRELSNGMNFSASRNPDVIIRWEKRCHGGDEAGQVRIFTSS